jgi:hypothetical protein
MTPTEQKIAHVAIRFRSRQPVATRQLEEAAILARRSKLQKTGAAFEEELARRRSGVSGGADAMGVTLKLAPQADRRFREELAKVRATVIEAAAGAGQDVRNAGGKIAGGLVVIGLGIFGAASIRNKRRGA